MADWLRSAGHDAVHVRELGLSDAPDREIFERAAANSRIVVTFDLDFGEIAGWPEVLRLEPCCCG